MTLAHENDGEAALHPEGNVERPVVTVNAVALTPSGTPNATVTGVLLLSGTLLRVLAVTAVDTVDALGAVTPEPDERLSPPWHALSARIDNGSRIHFTIFIFLSPISFLSAEIFDSRPVSADR
ncbi:hypothetical protein [Paraburkholderia sp.]|uniref:hypothetical protein n=1 Tax=Paraburkholderia sp. TaxID=1926495 RepID=UPI000EFBA7EB|nr:hypothetical protein [Paraburkholderia sp.]